MERLQAGDWKESARPLAGGEQSCFIATTMRITSALYRASWTGTIPGASGGVVFQPTASGPLVPMTEAIETIVSYRTDGGIFYGGLSCEKGTMAGPICRLLGA